MPLEGEAEAPVRPLDGFDKVVLRVPRSDTQFCTEPCDALMTNWGGRSGNGIASGSSPTCRMGIRQSRPIFDAAYSRALTFSVDTFSRTAAALASRGFVVIAPNVRGSTGYGLAFQKMNYQDLGGGDLQDEVWAAKLLAATGYVDPKKIGITGGSYGGYMTLMALGKTPDVWAAGVSQFGIVDWYTMLQHEDPRLQEYEKSLLGDPVKDRAVYENASPIKYLANAKAPLLVLQGENDIRVPKEEAEQVVDILKKAGKTVDAKYYPAEGHGFQKRENQIDAVKRLVEWMEKYLK